MCAYGPFERGVFPVGVKTYEMFDAARERALPVEWWYPASPAYAGKDLERETQDRFSFMPGWPLLRQTAVRDAEAAEGRWPLVMFSHGLAGHRRQTTHFCTHLASHGYIVASGDHTGNTMPEILKLGAEVIKSGNVGAMVRALAQSAADRPNDVSFIIDQVLAGEMRDRIDAGRIGMAGHSFGGWTTLAVTGRDRRIKAALPLAPVGGRSKINPQANAFADQLTLDFGRPVPLTLLVADQDSLLPLDGMQDIFGRMQLPKAMCKLANADHFHFADRVEQTHDLFRKMGGLSMLSAGGKDAPGSMKNARSSSELCPGAKAYKFLDGLGLLHMDAHLKDNAEARGLLDGDVAGMLAGREIEAEFVRG